MRRGTTGLSKEEQETVITFNEAEDMAEVYTINTRLCKRLREISERDGSKCEFASEDSYGFEKWKVDKRLVSLRLPMTEEGKETLRRKLQSQKSEYTSDGGVEDVVE